MKWLCCNKFIVTQKFFFTWLVVSLTRFLFHENQDVYRNSMPASSFQQQKLRVCEVCSAYLGLHDNDRRLADHFGGKLHLGFIEIREKLEKLRVRSTGARTNRHDFQSPRSVTSVSVCWCWICLYFFPPESSYRKARANANEKTRGTWKRRWTRTTVGVGEGARERAGERARMGERTRKG